MGENSDDNRKRLRMIGTYATIPFVLAVPIIIGWFIGSWIDKKLETSPIFMYLFLLFGFVAAIREIYRIIKKFGDWS